MMRHRTLIHCPGTLRARGFTLVEAVIVIILTAIVSAGVAVFLRAPVAGYVDAAARADLADTADTALRRMARDIRLALPNSVRLSPDGGGGYYIEFLLTRTGGRYLSTDDSYTSGNPLSFRDQDQTTANWPFDVVGPISTSLEQQIQPNSDSLVVYNLGQAPADAYQSTLSNTNRTLITAVSTNASTGVTTITLQKNVYAYQLDTQKSPSPSYRFQVISGPVTYHCDPVNQNVTRYWNYTISATQPTSAATMVSGSNALIATGVTGCLFTYTQASMNSALVVLNIQATTPGNTRGGTVGLFQQVHVDNTP